MSSPGFDYAVGEDEVARGLPRCAGEAGCGGERSQAESTRPESRVRKVIADDCKEMFGTKRSSDPWFQIRFQAVMD